MKTQTLITPLRRPHPKGYGAKMGEKAELGKRKKEKLIDDSL
jgi:hypothetical protein